MEQQKMDLVALYGISKGWKLLPRTVLVEGTSDVTLFQVAANLFKQETSRSLLDDLAIVAAGEGDRGGTSGVVRELIGLRNMASTLLSPSGATVYRVIGLFDNDTAGQKAVNGARAVDMSILEYRDVFRLRPQMPRTGSLDPKTLQRNFETLNQACRALPWELEDLISPTLMEIFLEEHPTALLHVNEASGFVHRELTRDGKSKLVRFCKEHADMESLQGLIDVLHALRHYMNLPSCL